MAHEAIHLAGQVRDGALGLARVHLGELGKGVHPTIQHLVAALHLFNEFARVDVWVAAAGDVVDHFGGDQDGAEGGGGGVGGFGGGELGERGEGVGEVDAVGREGAGLLVRASFKRACLDGGGWGVDVSKTVCERGE